MATISVLLPVYNCDRYISAAIDSVLHQTFGDFELLISDNASNDKTEEIIRCYRDPRIRSWRQKETVSMAKNWDFALQQASGEIAMVMGADDLLEPDHLEKRILLHADYPDAILSAGPHKTIDPTDQVTGVIDPGFRGFISAKELLPQLFLGNCLNILTVTFRLEPVRRLRLGFDVSFGRMPDWFLWLSLVLEGNGAVFSNSNTTFYRIHPSSVTSSISPATWALEARMLTTTFISENAEKLKSFGIDPDKSAKAVSADSWIIAQKLWRLGNREEAACLWRLYRKHHSWTALLWSAAKFFSTRALNPRCSKLDVPQ